MPVERLDWTPSEIWGTVNQRLRHFFRVLDASARVDIQALSATATVSLNYPRTLFAVDTTGADVTLTLPACASVPGYRVDAKKLIAAHTLTLDGHAAETIDGATTLAWTTRYQAYTIVSDGAVWHVV